MGIEKYLGVSYKLYDSENFDEFMKELGVGLVTRKLGNSVSATITLTEENGIYTLTTASTFKTANVSFKINEEFQEETIDGRQVTSIVTVEDNKLIHTQTGTVNTQIIREFSDDELVATLTVNNIVCTRKYRRV